MIQSWRLVMQLKAYKAILIFTLSIPYVGAVSAEQLSGQELLDAQKQKLEEIGIDRNKAGKDLYSSLSSEPQKVAESGCLDQIRGISVDAIVIDPTNLLGAVYSALKDELVSQGCSAATQYSNQLNDALNTKLELPHDIGTIEVGTGSSGSGDGGVFQPNVTLDNDEVAENVKDAVLNDAMQRRYNAADNVRINSTQQKFKSERAKDTSEAERKLENIIDIDKIWGGQNEGEEEGNND